MWLDVVNVVVVVVFDILFDLLIVFIKLLYMCVVFDGVCVLLMLDMFVLML